MAYVENSVLTQLRVSLTNAQQRLLDAQQEREDIELEKQQAIDNFNYRLAEQDKEINAIQKEIADTQAVVNLLESQLTPLPNSNVVNTDPSQES
jgi:uncharacterized coiled-coil protein SlyX